MLLLIVRKVYWEELRSGAKRWEYRRYGPRFNERVFRRGRQIAFGYRRDRTSPRLMATVVAFFTVPVARMPEMLEIYPDMRDDELIACIAVRIDDRGDPER